MPTSAFPEFRVDVALGPPVACPSVCSPVLSSLPENNFKPLLEARGFTV